MRLPKTVIPEKVAKYKRQTKSLHRHHSQQSSLRYAVAIALPGVAFFLLLISKTSFLVTWCSTRGALNSYCMGKNSVACWRKAPESSLLDESSCSCVADAAKPQDLHSNGAFLKSCFDFGWTVVRSFGSVVQTFISDVVHPRELWVKMSQCNGLTNWGD